jgi:hypothetical protein
VAGACDVKKSDAVRQYFSNMDPAEKLRLERELIAKALKLAKVKRK